MKTFDLKYENWGNYAACRNRREAKQDLALERKAYGSPNEKEATQRMSLRREKKAMGKLANGTRYAQLGRQEQRVADEFFREEMEYIDRSMLINAI